MLNKQLEIKNINFSFEKDVKILQGISLSIKKGTFLSILGASGSGKSTLLRIISNILPVEKRNVLDGSIDIFGETPEEYLETGKLSFMFQEPSLMPNLTVKDNIVFPLRLRGIVIDKILIEDLLNVVGLEPHQYKYPSELSGGMKTRVSLARAFITKPELLLLDEPFSALDISWKYDLYRYLFEFSNRYNTTVLFVTHDIQESVILGDDIIVLSQTGEVLAKRTPIKEDIKAFSLDHMNKLIENNLETILSLQSDILNDSIVSNKEKRVLNEK